MQIHIVFHINLYELAANNLLLGQEIVPQPTVDVGGQHEQEVLGVLNTHIFRRHLQYLV
jgi:hypothetical protein